MKITVLTICYNSGKYIEKAIKSVLNQNYDNIEHIIIDGGSDDDTINIIQKYPHLKWISEKDKGQCDAMNKAFDKASGDIIVYLNADDYFEENIFGSVINAFQRSDTQMVVGNLYIKKGVKITLVKPNIEFSKIIFPQKYSFPYNPVSYFYKREVQHAIGIFPLCENYAMDYWFLLRAFDKFRAVKMEIYFGTFFLNESSKTVLNSNNDTRRLASEYMKSKSFISRILFYINNLQIDIVYSILNMTWLKRPFKYLLFTVK